MSSKAVNELAFVNARIRGMKSLLLTVSDYERLLQVPTYEDFVKTLMATAYGPIISEAHIVGVPYPEDLGLILARHFADTVHSVGKSLTGRVRDFAESYLHLLHAESVKSVLRGVHVGLEREEILRYAVSTSPEEEVLFQRLADAGSVDRLIDLIPLTDMRLALLTRLPAYEQYNSTAPLEVALEEWGLRNILKSLSRFPMADQQRIRGLLEARVILRNLLTVLRAMRLKLSEDIIGLSLIRFSATTDAISQSMRGRSNWREVFARLESTRYADLASRLARVYGEEQNLADVEIAVEDYLAQRTRIQMVGYPFQLGTIFGFFGLKYYEIRNIRSIAVGIERGEPPKTIRRMITMF